MGQSAPSVSRLARTGRFRRRREARFAFRVPVTVEGAELTVSGCTRNLSIGGMFIECAVGLTYGDAVVVVARFPIAVADSRIPATVRWVTREGVGVALGELRAHDIWAIHQLVALADRPPANAAR
jgi:hypothetical protein